jgi:hypothetical protein
MERNTNYNKYFDYGNCIGSFEEFNELSKKIEQVRTYLSFSNFSKVYENDRDTKYEILIEYIKITLYILLMMISIFGNLIVIFIICCNKFMRKSTNFFILNLAICDLAILFSCMWVQMILTQYNNTWPLGELFCKFNSFSQMVSIIASVLTLSLISCDRYIGIVHPLKSKIITSKISYYLIIAAVWIVSILISIPTFIYRTYTERKWADFVERNCDDLGWPISLVKDENGCVLKATRPLKRIYYTSVIILLFFLPLIIMTITYSIMIKKLWSKSVITQCSMNADTSLKNKKKVF